MESSCWKFKKFKALFIGVILLVFPVVNSYGSGIQDSIQKIFKSKASDSLKIVRLGDLAYSTTVHAEVSEIILSMITFAEDLRSKNDLALCFRKISIHYLNLQYFDSALEYALKAVQTFKQINDKPGLAASYNVLANCYQSKGEVTNDTIFYNRCIEYHQKNIALRKELKDTVWLYISYINISPSYLCLGQFDKAIEYLTMANDFFTRLGNDGHALSLINVNLGDAYLGKAKSTGNSRYFSNAMDHYNYILTNMTKNMFPETYPEYIHALEYMGEVHYETGKLELCMEHLLKAHSLYRQINNKAGISSTALFLAKIFKGKNDQRSNEYLWTHLSYKDSLLNERNRINVEQMQAIYKSSEKEKEIQALHKDKEKQTALTDAGNKRKNIIIVSTVVGLLLVLVFLFFILNRFKVSREQKRIIEIQKETVDASQKKIIDSINYAKKIQYSILPSKEEISTCFPNHFVLFKPKDIVSGDFYWFHHENELSFFAVVDCTGHGVPGAFMTMIAHSILIEVVVEQKIISPEKILSNLHALVFKNLQQQKGDEYSQDGMDISIVVIDHKSQLLHFAGARNNAFIVNRGEVQLLKATQKSIGGLSLLGEIEPSREFGSETIAIKKDSLLILATDGFFDQLNQEDEKLGMTRFKEMIMSIKSTDQGFMIAEQTYLKWKGNVAQLDDILLAGIKL